ncbi:hypothetical protein GQ43DRAFT_386919 [Delitschia confertaspora ATCC 74209]|uniref:GAT domain-containing protein n=1 Tax=Delitschia confertaspora ATCC 74209 TaxID=1513339 RepID=A0A9P4JYK5_9PLEO|nr:hypothetical protein GQ43DRAFT_386919 [Delitschia confertaspora ATCC 74209]
MVLKKRFTNLLGKRPDHDIETSPTADTPEANVVRAVTTFCESGGANTGEEVLHLPTIVESSVASPVAAAAACNQIRKFLSKANYSRPHIQYNAVMLIRILADNPGPSFTKNMDKNFADTVKHLLREGKDPSVAQLLRETLEAMERDKAHDTNLNALFIMWRKEKTLMAQAAKQFQSKNYPLNAPAWSAVRVQTHHTPSVQRQLPPPVELAGRIEEARTSAKLLLQLVQSCPQHELLMNELVKEFSERCMVAQRSIQGYVNCDNPPPDDETMLNLIETNEQLSLALSKHQRAVLQARRGQGPSPSPSGSNLLANHPPPAVPGPSPPYGTYTSPSQSPPPSTGLPPIDFSSQSLSASPPEKNDPLLLPPTLRAGTGMKANGAGPVNQDDDPFGDHHSQGYAPPTTTRPSLGVNGDGAAPTPSYLHRQESSANHLTMHGGVPQQPLTEGDEYARDHLVSNGRPRTPEQTRRPESDVSPVAERGAVTYRY